MHTLRPQQEEQVNDSRRNEAQFREPAVSVSRYRLIWKKAETKIETSATGPVTKKGLKAACLSAALGSFPLKDN